MVVGANHVCTSLVRAIVGSLAGPAMARLVSGNGIKLTSSVKLINFQIYSFCSFVNFEANSYSVHLVVLALLIVG